MSPHITPGHNGWTPDAGRKLRAIGRREAEKAAALRAPERAAERERAELEYYEENGYPRPTGYFGAETDAHFYER